MKKLLFISISAILAAMMVTGCASKPKAGAKTESKKRVMYFSENGFSKNLIEFVSTPTTERDSAFVKVSEGNPIDLMAFYMAQSEVTYEDWYDVYTWAIAHGYKFENAGREGSNGTDGAAPTGTKLPVTMISWRDAVVWCNAASEKEGLTPVYKYNGAVLKESDGAKEGDGKAENAIIDETADGYRLPTEAEWEFAARGGDPKAEAWTKAYGVASDSPEAVAWYDTNAAGKAHDVMTKEANGFGVYDMNGNVWEWCYTAWASSNQRRIMRGGSYKKAADGITAVSKDAAPVSKKYEDVGFRVVKFALSQRDAK